MAARTSDNAGPAGGAEGLAACCGFPACDQDSTTERGMCELHQRVAISRTGSWLEAG